MHALRVRCRLIWRSRVSCRKSPTTSCSTTRSSQKKYQNARIPMADLYEAYFDGDIDIPGDIYAFLRRPQLVREVLADARALPLGGHELHPRGRDPLQEPGQAHRARALRSRQRLLRLVLRRAHGLHLRRSSRTATETPGAGAGQQDEPGVQEAAAQAGRAPARHRLRLGHAGPHAAKHYGVDATGVTIAENQTEFGNAPHQEWGVADRARIVCRDYRDIPKQKFDKIVSLEMVEHVGVKNLRVVLRAGARPAHRRRPVPPAVDRPAPRPAAQRT